MRPLSSSLAFLFCTAILSAQGGPVSLTEPTRVQDCQPCTIGSLNLFLRTDKQKGERTIRAIEVRRGSERLAELPVKDMPPVPDGEPFFFGPQDLNFDGAPDLLLMTEQGTANAYALYWLFDPRTSQYTLLGRYPMLKPDPATKRLVAYERGGYGGAEYEKSEYAVQNGKLVLMKSEKQELVRQPDTFRRTVKERVKGVMKTSSRRIVSGKEYDAR